MTCFFPDAKSLFRPSGQFLFATKDFLLTTIRYWEISSLVPQRKVI